MTRRAALFDLDGVLIDTEGIYYDFWANIDRLYPTGIEDFAAYIKGSTLAKIMNYFTDEEVRKDIVKLLEEHEETMIYTVFDGVIDFLEYLREQGIPCAIVTSSNEDKMNKLFCQNDGLKDYFDVIITDRQVTRSKPDPQGYLLAAEQLNCRAEDCWVFEDSYSGLEAGRRSGAKVIALSTTNPRHTLIDKADLVINSFKELDMSLFSKL